MRQWERERRQLGGVANSQAKPCVNINLLIWFCFLFFCYVLYSLGFFIFSVGSLWEVLCKYLARNLAGFVPYKSCQAKRLIKSALNWRDMCVCVCVASSGLGRGLQPPLASTPLCIAHTYVLPLLQLISITCPFTRLTRSTLLLNNSACLWRYFYFFYRCVCVCAVTWANGNYLYTHTYRRLWLVSALWLSVAYFMHPSTPFGTFLGYWLC